MTTTTRDFISAQGRFNWWYQNKEATGAKDDGGKAPVFRGAVGYFPRAMEAVAACSDFGASKYAWDGWRLVDNGFNRYSDAMVRHLVAEAKGEELDNDSGLIHAAHTAWNALARLELLLEAKEKEELTNERQHKEQRQQQQRRAAATS